MSKLKTYRVVIAQSVLTERFVKAHGREAAEDKAFSAYRKPKAGLSGNQWLGDGIEIVAIDEVQS